MQRLKRTQDLKKQIKNQKHFKTTIQYLSGLKDFLTYSQAIITLIPKLNT